MNEIDKIHNKMKRKVSKKYIKKIGAEKFRLLMKMITNFEVRHQGVYKFSIKDYKDFVKRVSESQNVLNMLDLYLLKKDKYCFPSLTLKKSQINFGKVEYSNITIKKIVRKEDSKYYTFKNI